MVDYERCNEGINACMVQRRKESGGRGSDRTEGANVHGFLVVEAGSIYGILSHLPACAIDP